MVHIENTELFEQDFAELTDRRSLQEAELQRCI